MSDSYQPQIDPAEGGRPNRFTVGKAPYRSKGRLKWEISVLMAAVALFAIVVLTTSKERQQAQEQVQQASVPATTGSSPVR
jgi:hypothetical protein